MAASADARIAAGRHLAQEREHPAVPSYFTSEGCLASGTTVMSM